MIVNLSALAHTWILDVDGTICKHNGYKKGNDILLPGVAEFFSKIPNIDFIVFITSRPESCAKELEGFLRDKGIRYDKIIYGVPYGERILINDCKPSGLKTAIAINKKRDSELNIRFKIDHEL